jgi:putative transposase
VAEVEALRGQGHRLKEALGVAGLSKSSYFYRPQPRSPRPLNGRLLGALEAISGREAFYGYRKKTRYLRVQGLWCNAKAVYRHLLVLGQLQPRKRKGLRHRALAFSRPTASNQRWEADLVESSCGIDGKGFGIALIDAFDKEVIAGEFSLRCRAQEVEGVLLDAVCKRFPGGYIPQTLKVVLRVDRGGQFIARRIISLARTLGIKPEICGLQTPNDKPYIESFYASYKTEEVYRNWYQTFEEAKQGWEDYIGWYNTQRLHQSLGYKTPAQAAPKPVIEKDALWIENLKTVSRPNPQLPQPLFSPV